MNSSPKEECVRNQKVPDLNNGDIARDGIFFRNLKESDISLVYREAPVYGKRINTTKMRKWADLEGQHGFSVNQESCIGSALCSILVHPYAKQFEHVWQIDLEVLNEHLSGFEDRFVALYKPELPDNACHFEIVPLDGTLSPTQLVSVLENLQRRFPPEGKEPPKPKRPPDGTEDAALSAQGSYTRLVKLHINVIQGD